LQYCQSNEKDQCGAYCNVFHHRIVAYFGKIAEIQHYPWRYQTRQLFGKYTYVLKLVFKLLEALKIFLRPAMFCHSAVLIKLGASHTGLKRSKRHYIQQVDNFF
jgi:hypothetical protein